MLDFATVLAFRLLRISFATADIRHGSRFPPPTGGQKNEGRSWIDVPPEPYFSHPFSSPSNSRSLGCFVPTQRPTLKRKREREEKNKKKRGKNVVGYFHSTGKNRIQRKSIDPASVPRLPIFIPARSNGNGNKRISSATWNP